jgi:hypothetical protein
MEPSAPEPSRDTTKYARSREAVFSYSGRPHSLRLHRLARASHAQSCMLNQPRIPIDFGALGYPAARAADRLQCLWLKEKRRVLAMSLSDFDPVPTCLTTLCVFGELGPNLELPPGLMLACHAP